MKSTYGFRDEEIDEEEGLHVPALHTWIFVCTDHDDPRGDGVYTSVTISDDDVQRLPQEQVTNLLAFQRKAAEMDLRDLGCTHDLPEIDLPVRTS